MSCDIYVAANEQRGGHMHTHERARKRPEYSARNPFVGEKQASRVSGLFWRFRPLRAAHKEEISEEPPGHHARKLQPQASPRRDQSRTEDVHRSWKTYLARNRRRLAHTQAHLEDETLVLLLDGIQVGIARDPEDAVVVRHGLPGGRSVRHFAGAAIGPTLR